MYTRFIEGQIQAAWQDTPVVVLNGPRQSGKTTLAKKWQTITPDLAFVTLDDENTRQAAQTDPVGFIRYVDRMIIDEIQRAPNLLLAIKKSVDEDRRPGRFLLTGSAHILTIPSIQESLAGRMEVIPLYPLARVEMAAGFCHSVIDDFFLEKVPNNFKTVIGDDLREIVMMGGYPEVLTRPSESRRQAWCHAYIAAILGRDIQDIMRIDKLGVVPKLLETMAHYSANLVNVEKISGYLGIDRKTTLKYLTVLQQLFLIDELRPWSNNELKRLIKTPKYHFMDTGILAAELGLTMQGCKKDPDAFGALLETFVYSELLKQSTWSAESVSFYHYRDHDKKEVDLVIENKMNEIVGIEIKAAATVTASDFAGMKQLQASVPGQKFKLGMVLYDGDQILPFGDKLYAAPISVLWGK